jgi:hypothetical protein
MRQYHPFAGGAFSFGVRTVELRDAARANVSLRNVVSGTPWSPERGSASRAKRREFRWTKRLTLKLAQASTP